MTPVLDASVFVSVISPAERHHRHAKTLFESHPVHIPFLVPELFRVEVLAALSRRGESDELLDTVDALVQGPRFYAYALDEPLLEKMVWVARRARLRAYDAMYVALALSRDVPLFTLDDEVAERSRRCFSTLRIDGA